MAAKKGPVDPLKAKEAKQKKIAIGGAVVLVLVMAIQVPKLMKQMNHSSAPPPLPAATSATPSTPTPTTPTDSGSSTGTGSLLSESAPTAAIGQFSSFGQFASDGQPANKDPFAGPNVPSTTTTAPPTPTTPKKPPTPPSPPTTTSTTSTTPKYTSALISVNGVEETVAVGGDFPAKQPFFHLISVSAQSAKISIAGGSLANGAASVTLQKGKALTLMNTTDGTRYSIVFLGQPTAGSGAGSDSSTTSDDGVSPSPSPPATTTTTTASTTTTTTP